MNRGRGGDRRHIVARGLRNLLTERVDWRAGAAQRFNGGVLIARRTDDIAARVEHGVERILEILLDEHTLAALRRRAAIIADHLEFHLLTKRLERPVESADEAVDRKSKRLNSSH